VQKIITKAQLVQIQTTTINTESGNRKKEKQVARANTVATMQSMAKGRKQSK